MRSRGAARFAIWPTDGGAARWRASRWSTPPPMTRRFTARSPPKPDELRIPINVADTPELCSFIAPAVIRRGDLQIAISTGGASPALAARIRRELEPRIGPEYARLLEVMRAARRRLMAGGTESGERARKLRALADSQLRECLAAGDDRAADAILIEHLGATLANLGLARHDPGARIDGAR